MKQTKYILTAIAITTGCLLYAFADNQPESNKVKPTSTPTTSTFTPVAPTIPQQLTAAEDGAPYGIQLTNIDNKNVTLRWNNPEATNGYFEDFEAHNDFDINSPGNIGWSYLDMDNEYTYTWTATSFPTQGQKMAYVIMNPSTTTPSVADWPAYQPYSGTKMLVAFTVDGGNNDYIISPELNFEENFQVSFRAKSYTVAYGAERVRVGYSTTGTQASNFTFVNEGDYVEVPEDWTLFKYEIPKEAKYITINCVSHEAFMLLIDDIFVGTNRVRPKAQSKVHLEGFNLYRNNVKINNELITEVFYTDIVAEYGNYQYSVSAVYSDGSEKRSNEIIDVNVPDIRLLPFFDDFNTNTLSEDKWSAPDDQQGNPSKWSSSYHPYGLVDYSAQYIYSSLKNYSQSLITTELHTLDPENTYLRFNLRHINYNNEVGDTLAVEISCDNEQTWQRIAAFGNDEQTFDWRVEQYCLKDLLTNKLFKIRFRAFGVDAYYIDYWYVDDVKVWCPEWASASLNVQSQGAPLSNVKVNLTANHGAIIEATTDNNGTIEIPVIEKGLYTISIKEKGYNDYSNVWDVTNEQNNFTAIVTRPNLQLSTTDVHCDMLAETQATQSITLTNTGDGVVSWNIAPQYTAGSGNNANCWDIQNAFDASGDLQTSIAFDGEYFYTTSTFFLNTFYKYDRNGNFIEEFSIPGLYYMIYDLAFDGTYFYGSDYSNILFCLDLRNKRLVKEIVIESEPSLKITHCSYDPRNDQFWVGTFYTIGRVDRNGKVTVDFRNISNEIEVGAFGSAFDNITPGGPYLWFSNEELAGTNQIDQLQILQYNLNTRTLTNVSHLVDDVPGYKIGNINVPTYICGVEATTTYVDGKLSLVGIIKQSPSRIFVYELAEAQDWLSIEPKAGKLESGASQEITINVDTRNSIVGETYNIPLQLYTTPELGKNTINVSHTITGASATPRPSQPQLTAEGVSSVYIIWNNTASKQPDGYNIYRNGKRVNETLVKETSYTDTQLVAGSYTYTITSLYNNIESEQSDESNIYLNVGAPYYKPVSLTHNVVGNSIVNLAWQRPDAILINETTLRWDNGRNNNAMGAADGGYYWGGVEWNHTELADYRNMKLDTVQVFIQERFLSLSLQIYKDNKRIVSQNINKNDVVYGTFNKIGLTTPINIEPGCDYRIAFLVAHDAGMRPLGIDDSAAVNGKGNLVSTDGKEWYPLTHIGMNGNFNIAMHLSPGDTQEEQPAGYHVYRDGERITQQPTASLNYRDELTTAGVYEYCVSSVYADGGESTMSQSIKAEIIELDVALPPRNVVATTEYNRTIHLRWDFPIAIESSFPVDLTIPQATAEEGYPEYVSMFRGNMSGEMGIASDGQYIYTSMHSTNGTINKYSMQGEFIESILISRNLNGIRNIAFDGSNFYIADGNSFIYHIDIENRSIIDTLSVSEIARHIAYIPELDNGRGGFEVGDWETSIYVSKQGAKLNDGPALKGAAGSAYYNGTLYTFEQGYENPYTICCYDLATGELQRTINIGDYVEITPEIGAMAGGMSVITTNEGLKLLAIALQEQSNCRFIFLDLGSITGLSGYNIYRNGEKRNDQPIPFRYFTEDESVAGTYEYEIETVYIDGSTSDRSHIAYVDIYDADHCDAPCDVKVVQSSYGYNVNISFVDPTSMEAALYESFESYTTGVFSHDRWNNLDNGWQVTDQVAYQGKKSLQIAREADGWLIIPTGKPEDDMVITLVARNEDDHKGNGILKLLTSVNGNNTTDFIPVGEITTTEAWKQYEFTIPAGTDFVAIRHEAGQNAQYIDAISIDYRKVGQAYGYDIIRDGVQLNKQLITDICYTDRNLLPGKYNYQIRAYYNSSCISDYSETVTIDLDYSNGCQKPGMLFVETLPTGANNLAWSAPALGDVVNLRWHNGSVHDAAGMPSGGAFFAGVQWNATELKEYERMSLSEVEVYINQIPDALFLLVYEGENLISQQYVPDLKQYSFNTIELEHPVAINTNKTLRVVVYVEHNEISVPLGYDEGPSKIGRGDLYSTDGVNWSTLNANDIDGNWNITLGLRAYADNGMAKSKSVENDLIFTPINNNLNESIRGIRLAHSVTSERNAFIGYNIYCNSELLNNEPIQDTYYIDEETHAGNFYEYQVKALYSGCGEVGSNVVRITSTANIDNIDSDVIKVAVRDKRVFITGLKAGSIVTLYDTAGKVIHNGVSTDEYEYVINITNLPKGVYLIQVGDETFKITL